MEDKKQYINFMASNVYVFNSKEKVKFCISAKQ